MLKAPGVELCQNACGVVNEPKISCSHQCSPECSMNKYIYNIYLFIERIYNKYNKYLFIERIYNKYNKYI